MKITYFINQYPKVSHAFIRREILALEEMGFKIQRISLRGWHEKLVDDEDVTEQSKTQYILKRGFFKLLMVALSVFITRPLLFLKTFSLAVKMGFRADRPLLFHVMYFIEACQTYAWIKDFRSEHMHAHFGTNSSEVMMLVNALSNVPYSFTVHGPEEFDRPLFLKLPQKINNANFVVAISSFGRSQLMRWVPHDQWHKIKVVHCGLEPNFYEMEHHAIQDTNQIVCVGRLCEQKGQLLLVEAARLLQERGVSFELVLAGDGEMRSAIEALIERYQLSSKVKITGWISGTQVREYLLSSRGLVLPSFAEGLPVVIMEAMSLKRPVISTYIAGIPELVDHGQNGWLVPAGSLGDLVDALLELINAPISQLQQMGIHAHRKVLERHSIGLESKKLADLFELSRSSVKA